MAAMTVLNHARLEARGLAADLGSRPMLVEAIGDAARDPPARPLKSVPAVRKYPGLCKAGRVAMGHAKAGVLEGRSSQIAPASLAGLSAPGRDVAELSRTGQFRFGGTIMARAAHYPSKR